MARAGRGPPRDALLAATSLKFHEHSLTCSTRRPVRTSTRRGRPGGPAPPQRPLLNLGPNSADKRSMGGQTPTRAARRFRVVVILGSAALCGSVFLPWCRINGFTYTFLDVDSWKVLPIAELVVISGAVIAAMIRLARIKRIGLFLGSTALGLNVAGAFVAARFANVHNPDPYFRIWAVLSVGPAWGGWVALLACGVLLVGSLSRWLVCGTILGVAPAGTGASLHSEHTAGGNVHGIPIQRRANDGDFHENSSRPSASR
jgi:hypothetical protein